MIRRLVWVGVGVALGVYAVRQVSRTREALSPTGVGAGLAGVGEALLARGRAMGEEFRVARAEREAELREALGIAEPPASTDPVASEDPRGDRR